MFQRVLLDFVLKTFGLGAENETRTRDPNLGKVVLYQLSYFRRCFMNLQLVLSDCECKDRAKILFSKIFVKKNAINLEKYEKYPTRHALGPHFWAVCGCWWGSCSVRA